VLPVVARLLIPIPETNSSLIAECLGLDGTKFAHFSVDEYVCSALYLSPCYVLSLPCTNSRALCSKGTAAAEAQAELLASENDEERYEHAEKLL